MAGKDGGEEGGAPAASAAKAPQPSNPQKVLSKLQTARVRWVGCGRHAVVMSCAAVLLCSRITLFYVQK